MGRPPLTIRISGRDVRVSVIAEYIRELRTRNSSCSIDGLEYNRAWKHNAIFLDAGFKNKGHIRDRDQWARIYAPNFTKTGEKFHSELEWLIGKVMGTCPVCGHSGLVYKPFKYQYRCRNCFHYVTVQEQIDMLKKMARESKLKKKCGK